MNDIQKYSNTERLYVAQFGGKLIKDARQWEIDADVRTWKVRQAKTQLKASAKYGNIAIGVETSNPNNGKTRPDWFGYIATTGFAILCTHPKTKQAIWIRCRPSELKQWVEQNKTSLRKFNLQPSVIEHNIKQGRVYVDGWGYLIPVQKLLDAGFQYTVLNQEYTTKWQNKNLSVNMGT